MARFTDSRITELVDELTRHLGEAGSYLLVVVPKDPEERITVSFEGRLRSDVGPVEAVKEALGLRTTGAVVGSVLSP